jgi:predicted O-methyltransferase YrrM
MRSNGRKFSAYEGKGEAEIATDGGSGTLVVPFSRAVGERGETMRESEQIWQQILEEMPSAKLDPMRGELVGFRDGLARSIAMLDGPIRYLEIGVRHGHSLGLVCLCAGTRLDVAIGVDLFIDEYAGEPSSLEILEQNLIRLDIRMPRVILIEGNSHEVLPVLRGLVGHGFNLICVDGDHTADGARRDLDDALDLLEPGGVLIFDDCIAGSEGDLRAVWLEWHRQNLDRLDRYGEVIDPELAGVPAWARAKRRSE